MGRARESVSKIASVWKAFFLVVFYVPHIFFSLLALFFLGHVFRTLFFCVFRAFCFAFGSYRGVFSSMFLYGYYLCLSFLGCCACLRMYLALLACCVCFAFLRLSYSSSHFLRLIYTTINDWRHGPGFFGPASSRPPCPAAPCKLSTFCSFSELAGFSIFIFGT